MVRSKSKQANNLFKSFNGKKQIKTSKQFESLKNMQPRQPAFTCSKSKTKILE